MKSNNQSESALKTILVITVGMLVIYAISKQLWALYAALGVGLSGVFSDLLARKIQFLWMKLARVLSFIVPNILLSIIFYLLLTPIALLSRIFGEKNQLSLKNTSASLFKDRNKDFSKESFEKPW